MKSAHSDFKLSGNTEHTLCKASSISVSVEFSVKIWSSSLVMTVHNSHAGSSVTNCPFMAGQRPNFPQISFALSSSDSITNIFGVYLSMKSAQSDFTLSGKSEQTLCKASSISVSVELSVKILSSSLVIAVHSSHAGSAVTFNTFVLIVGQRPNFPQISFGVSSCDNKANIWGVYVSMKSAHSDFKLSGNTEHTLCKASSISVSVEFSVKILSSSLVMSVHSSHAGSAATVRSWQKMVFVWLWFNFVGYSLKLNNTLILIIVTSFPLWQAPIKLHKIPGFNFWVIVSSISAVYPFKNSTQCICKSPLTKWQTFSKASIISSWKFKPSHTRTHCCFYSSFLFHTQTHAETQAELIVHTDCFLGCIYLCRIFCEETLEFFKDFSTHLTNIIVITAVNNCYRSLGLLQVRTNLSKPLNPRKPTFVDHHRSLRPCDQLIALSQIASLINN